MKRTSAYGLSLLLLVVAAVSATYYVAGVIALNQEFFHPSRYAREPFEFADDGETLKNVRREALSAGLHDGDVLLSVNRQPFTGSMQLHELVRHSRPGDSMPVSTRHVAGDVLSAGIRLAPREGPDFPLSGLIAFLTPVLGIPLLGLLVGYWVVAARPRDLNAWLVLVLLIFPQTSFGNLDWNFWPAPWNLLLGLWNFLIQILVFPALLWFGFLFPERWRMDRRLPWIKYVVLAVTVASFSLNLFLATKTLFAVQTFQRFRSVDHWNDRVSNVIQITSILLFLVAVFDKLRSASTADARRRIRVLAVGSGLSLGPILLIFVLVPLFGGDPHHGNWFIAIIPLLSLFPLTLAYVLIVERAMDVRILLRMGTKYLLARATLLLLEIVFVGFILVRFVLPMMRGPAHQTSKFILLAVCLAVLFQAFIRRNSLGSRLERWLDRRFFREAYNSEVILSELSHQVRHLSDRGDVIDIVLGRIAEVLHVSELAVLLRGSQVFHLQGAFGMDLTGPVTLSESSATVQNLIRTNEPATVYRDRPETWFTEAGAEEQEMLRRLNAELLLPMPGRDRLVGVLALGPKRSEEPYTPTDLRTLQSVAAQTGLTLEVAELARSLATEAAQRERVNREIEIAREVQQRLFPQTIPEIPGLSLAGLCRPASEVGGDYFDLIALDDGHLGFAIGDVSGKGISAALIMASLRASLRGLVLDDPGDLATMMQKVNRLVYEASSSARYATFFFATYNPASRELRYVNAGHNPPILVRASSGQPGEVVRLEAGGPVVGLLPSVSYDTQSLTLEPGDLLLAYTDGISEAMTHDDEEWGEDRMLAAALSRPAAPAADLIETLFRAADAFTAGAQQHDDMTLLAMQLHPAPSSPAPVPAQA